MTTDAERTKKYLANDGVICPYCGENHVSPDAGHDYGGAGNRVSINVHCNRCGKAWTEEFTLTGVTWA